MDLDLFGILFMVVVLPVVLGVGYAVFDRWTKLKEAQFSAMSKDTAEKAAQYAARSKQLEERVAVLERIITDGSTKLANEIEDLRETQAN